MTNNYDYDISFDDAAREVFLTFHFLEGLTPRYKIRLQPMTGTIKAGEERVIKAVIGLPSQMGNYDVRFSIEVDGIEPPINSRKYPIVLN